jgi:hypothetical protein
MFRFELVMGINVTTHELLDREELIAALFASQLVMLLGEERKERLTDESYLQRLAQCRELTDLRVNELLATREARSSVEARYLDGHAALFPDVAAAWDEQLKRTEALAAMAIRLAELDDVPPAVAPDPETISRRTTALVADLVEPAKAEALEKLGEGRQALGIAEAWVRAKLAPKEARLAG